MGDGVPIFRSGVGCDSLYVLWPWSNEGGSKHKSQVLDRHLVLRFIRSNPVQGISLMMGLQWDGTFCEAWNLPILDQVPSHLLADGRGMAPFVKHGTSLFWTRFPPACRRTC